MTCLFLFQFLKFLPVLCCFPQIIRANTQANSTIEKYVYENPIVVNLEIAATRVRSVNEISQSFQIEVLLRMYWLAAHCAQQPVLCKPVTGVEAGVIGIPFCQFDNANQMSIETLTYFCPGYPQNITCVDTALKLTVFKEYQLYDFFYDSQNLTSLIQMWWTTDLAVFKVANIPTNILDQNREVSPTTGVPNGWDFVRLHIEQFNRTFPSIDYLGDYSGIALTVEVKRNPTVWKTKILLPLWVIAFFTFSSFLMGMTKTSLNHRIGSCFSALLIFVVFNLFLLQLVPSADHLSYTDRLFAGGMVYVLAVLVATVVLRVLAEIKYNMIDQYKAEYYSHLERNSVLFEKELMPLPSIQCEDDGRDSLRLSDAGFSREQRDRAPTQAELERMFISKRYQLVRKCIPMLNYTCCFVLTLAYVLSVVIEGTFLGQEHAIAVPTVAEQDL